MSARVANCAFFAMVLIGEVIDCTATSTSQQGISSSSSPVTRPSTSGDGNTTEPLWMPEAIKDIAYYLRGHKFNEYDRRYEKDVRLARREYYKGFPRPPLRSLHWEVHKNCVDSLSECANYLRKRIKSSGLKRTDDTAAVIHEQHWDLNNNSKQIQIVDEDCKKMSKLDDIQANPFEGPLERFQWRVTASYYLCWYTMKSHPALEHLADKCDNFANCLDPDFGPHNRDPRTDDAIPYACALYSFCPDPCCPEKHLTRPENCWNMPDNPCFEANPVGQRECVLKRPENTDFRDLILNRWNVTCRCPKKGFEWSSFYGICTDINECALGTHTCDPDTQICLNLPGSFQCACKWGHIYNPTSKKCTPSDALVHLVLNKQKNEEEKVNETLWGRFLRLFAENSSSMKTSLPTNLIIASCTLVYFRL